MCLDILRNPSAAIINAKRSKDSRKAWVVLIEASLIFVLSAAVTVLKQAGIDQLNYAAVGLSLGTIFLFMIVLGIIFGYIITLIATTLGGTGRYNEGLTVISYSLVPISAAALVSSVLSIAPVGAAFAIVAVALGLAASMSILYRSTKEMFKTDMITAFVAVSVLILVVILTSSTSFGFASLTNLLSA